MILVLVVGVALICLVSFRQNDRGLLKSGKHDIKPDNSLRTIETESSVYIDVEQTWRDLGSERARDYLVQACKENRLCAFDGHSRFAQVLPKSYHDRDSGDSWDSVELKATLDLDHVRVITCWSQPPGLKIKSLKFTETGLKVNASFSSSDGKLIEHEFFIPWQPEKDAPSGLFDYKFSQ
jgi:hypothetical protein